jgi:hypothetical protein
VCRSAEYNRRARQETHIRCPAARFRASVLSALVVNEPVISELRSVQALAGTSSARGATSQRQVMRSGLTLTGGAIRSGTRSTIGEPEKAVACAGRHGAATARLVPRALPHNSLRTARWLHDMTDRLWHRNRHRRAGRSQVRLLARSLALRSQLRCARSVHPSTVDAPTSPSRRGRRRRSRQ